MSERDEQQGSTQRRQTRLWPFLAIVVVVAVASAVLSALLLNIFQRKQEAKDPYLKLVNVSEATTDPAPCNFSNELLKYSASPLG